MKTYLTDFKVFPKTLESHDSLACILDDFMTMSGVSAPIKGVLANMKKRVADTIGYVQQIRKGLEKYSIDEKKFLTMCREIIKTLETNDAVAEAQQTKLQDETI